MIATLGSWIWNFPPMLFCVIGFVVNILFGKRIGQPLAGWIGTALCGLSFVSSLVLWLELLKQPEGLNVLNFTYFEWMQTSVSDGSVLSIDFGILVDPLSVTMCLFITSIATLIHLYSIGYMKGDQNFGKFFAYLNLFVASMLVLVLGDNLIMTFLGWEGVGVCSYLLISFWFEDSANATAGKKAFVTNRVGDFGFLLAAFIVFDQLGTLSYDGIAAGAPHLSSGMATALVLLFMLAASAKSAQLPLFVWLPDAMAGPTPVSALIHAATMVTSGVFLLIRLNPVLHQADGWSLGLISWIGMITALTAATTALAQKDIKKVLAYSTISQLGYLFAAVGVGAYVAAMFHMITHAFFKALLFLGAGSVIHGVDGEQDMDKMGGLRKFMPITSATFIVGWLAISGLPPFSGFWSKDEILAYLWGAGGLSGFALWIAGIITAALTAFYMTRQVIMVFLGAPNFDAKAHPPHESPKIMTVPLIVLAVAAAIGGLLNLPFSKGLHVLGNWLEPSLMGNGSHFDTPGWMLWLLALIAIGVGSVSIFLAKKVYYDRRFSAEDIERPLFKSAWGYDNLIARVVEGPGQWLFNACGWFDNVVLDGAVRAVSRVPVMTGMGLRSAGSANVRWAIFAIMFGSGAIALWLVTRIGA